MKVTGCTVHFVDSGIDTGPIIAQAAVPVHEDDDEESLRARILAEEHRLLPAVVRAIAERRVVDRGSQGAHPRRRPLGREPPQSLTSRACSRPPDAHGHELL